MGRHGIAGKPGGPPALDPERARRDGRPPFAIVDIGSNSVRLVVYDRLGRAPFPRFNEKSLCRLGAGLDRTGELSAESFRRTVEAMRRFRAIADAMGVPRVEAIATEAVRRASNGGRLVAAIAAEAGFAVRVLSGAEEAHHAALGVVAGFHRPAGLVGDMGGGSLEVAEIADDRVGPGSVSLPLGALPVQALLATGRGDAKRRLDSLLGQGLPPAALAPRASSPVPPPIADEELVQVNIRVRRALGDQLADRARAEGTTQKVLVCRALAAAGFGVQPEDLKATPAPRRRGSG